MNIEERNKKVALNRWKKILTEQTSLIKRDKVSLLKKAAICGFLAGDGSVQVRDMGSYSKYQLDLFADDKLMLKTYNEYISKVYNRLPKVSFRDNVNVSRISQRYIVLDLLKEARFGLKKWSFPSNLFKIKGAEENWLRAFFSAEGYVNKTVLHD